MDHIKSAITTLKAAQKLIGTPEKWCKGSFARTPNGAKVSFRDPDACAWCSLGAIRKIPQEGMNMTSEEYLDTAMYNKRIDSNFGGCDFVVRGNDSRTTEHLHIMMAYDFAILMAKDDLKVAQKELKQISKA